MSKYRRAARIDENQPEIVSKLRKMGVSVETNKDDILCGWKGKTYWFEIKSPNETLKKDGSYKAGSIKPSQIELQKTWAGHYQIVHSIDQILEAIL